MHEAITALPELPRVVDPRVVHPDIFQPLLQRLVVANRSIALVERRRPPASHRSVSIRLGCLLPGSKLVAAIGQRSRRHVASLPELQKDAIEGFVAFTITQHAT